MAGTSAGETVQLIGAWARLSARGLRARLRRLIGMLDFLHASPPNGLIIAPQDIRTFDPTIAPEIYARRFTFCGKTVSAGGRSIFEQAAPSIEWAETLHGFGWLRQLRVADHPLFSANARALIDDWINRQGQHPAQAWQLDVTARRILAWLSQSPLILGTASAPEYRRFMRSLWMQVRWLQRLLPDARDGTERMLVLIALTQAGLCNEGQEKLAGRGLEALDREIDRQILSDGGHVSRNAQAIVTLLLEFLPLRQVCLARQIAPPARLTQAIDRMMPMLRFFRHGEGSFGLFNGVGTTSNDDMATLAAYDDAHGAPALSARASGYERLEAGDNVRHTPSCVVLMDTGAPPPLLMSREAHAGALSFELSSEGQRIIVNCGMPIAWRAMWQMVGRQSAAHSTLVLDKRSSAHIVGGSGRLRGLLVGGGRRVEVIREERADGTLVTAANDGYRRVFGLRHQRRLWLRHDGHRLEGEDELLAREGTQARAVDVAIRFHLHPAIEVGPGLVMGALLLHAGHQQWQFSAAVGEVTVEDSVFLGAIEGAKASRQIVIRGNARQDIRYGWTLERLA